MSKFTLQLLLLLTSQLIFAQYFQRIETGATETQRSGRTAGMVDFNDDGKLDAFITNGDSNPSEIYINNGTEFNLLGESGLSSARIPAVGANVVDVDNDSDLDLYITSWYGSKNLLLLNQGNSFTVDEGNAMNTKSYSEAAGWADYNNDGYLDAAVANSNGTINVFYTNNGDGSFLESTLERTTLDSRCVSWADYDNDGDQDLLVTNEQNTIYFYVNDDGALNERNNAIGGVSAFSASWGDMDNDGDLDLFLARFGDKNVLYENENGRFTELANAGVSRYSYNSISSSWGDIDNDGDIDLIVTNGFDNRALPIEAYINNGDKSFTEITDDELVKTFGSYYGVALGDYTNDGYLDILVASVEGNNLMFTNQGLENGWIQLNLEGVVSNKDAIGARIYLYQSADGSVITQTREVSSNSGYSGLNDIRAHFGLGDLSVDSIEIFWPEGHLETIYNPETNTTHNITETMPDAYVQAHFLFNGEQIEGSQISFIDNSKFDDSYEITYAWDFDGDGQTDSNEEAPTYIFPEVGTYTVSLNVSNENKNSTLSKQLTIESIFSVEKTESYSRFFPNPSHSKHIRFNSEKPVEQITVWNSLGQKIMQLDRPKRNLNQLQIDHMGPILLKVLFQDGSTEAHRLIVGF